MVKPRPRGAMQKTKSQRASNTFTNGVMVCNSLCQQINARSKTAMACISPALPSVWCIGPDDYHLQVGLRYVIP